jgi:hypothetical protein
MRLRYLAAPLLLLAILATACPPPATLSPHGQVVWTADQIIVRLGELQNTAIAANAATDPKTGLPGLPTATTHRVVTYCVGTTKTLHTLPAGWQATLQTGLTQFLAVLTPAERAKLDPILGLVTTAVSEFIAASAGGTK